MNWQQYLLGKVAEEAVEVAKEALKNQSFGMESIYQGVAAWEHLRHELIDLMSVTMMAADPEPRGLIPFAPVNQVVANQLGEKSDKVCYYAMFVYRAKQLTLTLDEFIIVHRRAMVYGAKHNLEYVGDITYHS
jgi:hypothetical protein